MQNMNWWRQVLLLFTAIVIIIIIITIIVYIRLAFCDSEETTLSKRQIIIQSKEV